MRRTWGGRGRRVSGKGRTLRQTRRKLRYEQLNARMLLAGDSGLEFEPLPLYYDVNADDALTPHDALVVVNSLASKTSASELPSADVDRNAVIEANDARLVLEALILQTAPAAARGLVEADQATGEQRDWGAGREGLAPVMESDTPEPISPSGLAMQTLTTGTTGPSGPTGETTTTGTTGPTSPSGPTGETASTGTTGPAPPPPPGGETTGGELRYGPRSAATWRRNRGGKRRATIRLALGRQSGPQTESMSQVPPTFPGSTGRLLLMTVASQLKTLGRTTALWESLPFSNTVNTT